MRTWRRTLSLLSVALALPAIGAAADGVPVEDFAVAARAGLPAAWRQTGTWIFSPDLACQVVADTGAALERSVRGDAWIEAGIRQVGIHFGRRFGVEFRVSGQAVQLERRQNAKGPLAVLVYRRDNHEPVEISAAAPVRDVTLRLERVQDTFHGWLINADGSRTAVGKLAVTEFGALAQAAAYVHNSALRPERVRLTRLRVGGERPAADSAFPVYDARNRLLGFVTGGHATLTYPNGNRYTGGYLDGAKQGTGTFVWATGQTYSGDYKNDQMHGTGTYTWADGGKYTGSWRQGEMNGYGNRIYADGGTYVGQWQDGQPHGAGTRTWPNGHTYVGQFVNGKMQGTGTYTWADGGKYTGAWQAGRMHGQGLRTWPDGTSYEGEFLSDRASGGWYERANGSRSWAYQNDDGAWVQEQAPEQ